MRSAYRWVGVALLFAASACYKSVPLETSTPPVGQTVSFVISDQGRVALGERLGPGIARIEGRMLGTDGDQYLVSVFRTAALGGATSVWSGEEMRLDRTFVARLEGRELSKTRTWITVGVATSVLAAFIISRGLNGLFGEDGEPPDPGDPPISSRVPHAIRP